MVIYKTKDFIDGLERLPKEIKKLFQKQENIFRENWLDSRLHTRRIKELSGAYSLRITRSYRALFYFENDRAVFFSIGHRKDIYDF